MWIKDKVRDELISHQTIAGVSSLATGTDQIFAAVVLDLGLELRAVIPCDDYASAFPDETSRTLYARYNKRATRHYRLHYDAPSEEAFLKAGQQVVDLSDFMVFVWDGKPAAGRGGTADIVKYASAKNVPFVHLNPVSFRVEAN